VSASSFQREYFEKLYSKHADPWKFATSDYERAKYTATIDALQKKVFSRAFEVGCSIGILTARLALRTRSLLAIDASETAVKRAIQNCKGLANISFQRMQIPNEWPTGRFDLIMLSEVLYFLNQEDIRATSRRLMNSLMDGGEVVLVNWIGGTDYPCGGDEAAQIFLTETAQMLKPTRSIRAEWYRLDALRVR
jgi:2-polyprenyl-3-methyl-5-hydroxy-6-metoxy-1,4-benzoquinol methylase